MVEWKSDVNQFDLFNPPRSAMFLKDDDLMGGEGYMLTDHHYMDSRDNGDHVCDAWERIDHTLPSPTPSEDVLESLSGSINTAVAAGKDKQGPKPKAVRAPRKRKAPGEKADRLKLPKLTKPLSELTRDYHHLPVRNMESWVTRSAETRWQEVEKRGGYVTRPMNSFMLYRSAYAERTKLWCLQNNHQVVSSVSGESWPLEPPAVREKYNEMAKLERFNHQAAHPGYKFSPSKAQNNSRKRKCSKAAAEEKAAGAEGDITDLDDLDLGLDLALVGSASSSSAKKPPASRKRPQKSTGAGAGVGTGVGAGVGAGAAGNNSLVYLNFPYDLEAGGAHRSSFNHTNPGKTPPACMGTQDMAGQYYQTTVRASSSAVPISNLDGSAVIEDVTIRRAQAPGSGSHYIPQQPRTHVKTEAFDDGDDNSNVDPLLLGDQYQLLPSHYMHDPNGGGDGDGSRAVDFEPLFASQILESAGTEGPFDAEFVRELPGYCDDMEGFLDDVEPWAVEGADGAELCYDEWLEGSGV
ncbi:hypothetical protein BZA05DRAFT_369184 [Tricharina praecox]|uniref:uncharacterized protein n=1 Tax=Tricharina praecox TaxID=43433 RepID=UPI0022208C0E|nr:uncharacterized protein BZA05DRAFT_369184 [Tricharina praecox]KAI5855677.1 hypothetical protein BZA05DRAFT_369184 [Tricharina praecox]